MRVTLSAIEESRKLPAATVMLPMTALSQLLQTTMHLQQFITSLAIRGDQLFSHWGGEPPELPEWATFDEDEPTAPPVSERDTSAGRFALYSMPPRELGEPNGDPTNGRAVNGAAPQAGEPEIAEYLDYDSFTLAQLRARLRSLSLDELTALLDYEQCTLARVLFLTMLENRIASYKRSERADVELRRAAVAGAVGLYRKVAGWIDRLGSIWVEGQLTQINVRS